jgi:putative oxidoreductase
MGAGMIQETAAFGLLPIRILAGIAFIVHEYLNFQTLVVLKYFWKSGLPPDLAILIGLLKVIGGIALSVEVLTR